MVWAYVGDALWVIALSIMFTASRQAWRSLAPAGSRGARLRQGLAVWALPAGAFAFSLWLALEARVRPADGDEAFILFGVRAVAASLLALAQLRWLRSVLKAFDGDGALKP